MSLIDLYQNHQGKSSDKWALYLDIYDSLFKELKDKPISLLEIGVQNGGSLEILAKYFTYVERIIGCDIDENCRNLTYDHPGISVIVGDCNLEATQNQISKVISAFDIIIDDGSHLSGDIIRAFTNFFPKLKEDGIYIIEDLHCSYWTSFEGGLFNPLSAINFFKCLIDIINGEYWDIDNNVSRLLTDFFIHYQCNINKENLSCIHSISFYNSVCIIRKKNSDKNTLSHRILAGDLYQVCNNTSDQACLKKAFENLKINSQCQLDDISAGLRQKNITINKLINLNETLINEYEALTKNYQASIVNINTLLSTKSWRLTAPLRYLKKKIAQLKHKLSIKQSLN